jgi:arsenate reductase (thioredoxin)
MFYICKEILSAPVMRILILCTGNSCRSQMAAGFMRSFDKRLDVRSAGTNPAASVNAKAIQVMSEAGIDIGGEKPKAVDKYLNESWDYVITVCDDANETCPFFPGIVKNRLHFSFEDPSHLKGSEEHVMSGFRKTRDRIKQEFRSLYEIKIKPELK